MFANHDMTLGLKRKTRQACIHPIYVNYPNLKIVFVKVYETNDCVILPLYLIKLCYFGQTIKYFIGCL